MSEFERPDRLRREPTVEDVRQLMGASTPHFAIQLRNLDAKLPLGARIKLIQRDSTALGFLDASYDQALVFFLLHEQPDGVAAPVRCEELLELRRVVRWEWWAAVVDDERRLVQSQAVDRHPAGCGL